MDMNIVDKGQEAKWYMNRALYPFAHALREGVAFQPGQPTRIVPDDWMKGQPLIVECPDPMSGEEMPEQVKVESLLRDPDTGEPAETKAPTASKKK